MKQLQMWHDKLSERKTVMVRPQAVAWLKAQRGPSVVIHFIGGGSIGVTGRLDEIARQLERAAQT